MWTIVVAKLAHCLVTGHAIKSATQIKSYLNADPMVQSNTVFLGVRVGIGGLQAAAILCGARLVDQVPSVSMTSIMSVLPLCGHRRRVQSSRIALAMVVMLDTTTPVSSVRRGFIVMRKFKTRVLVERRHTKEAAMRMTAIAQMDSMEMVL
jgi:hypothetical protein